MKPAGRALPATAGRIERSKTAACVLLRQPAAIDHLECLRAPQSRLTSVKSQGESRPDDGAADENPSRLRIPDPTCSCLWRDLFRFNRPCRHVWQELEGYQYRLILRCLHTPVPPRPVFSPRNPRQPPDRRWIGRRRLGGREPPGRPTRPRRREGLVAERLRGAGGPWSQAACCRRRIGART